ncbi:MAG: 7-carboxy-7-deazaguanine synthase QueE, partial [Candidatus Cloacimonetes bacterium]|nr:7-carboxy-7-deazaguanine synthase QueE [Candidatus Cloacimonadota bacterium]
MLNLSEIFFSIQGESSYTGLPCIFIRLAGCNLRCKYCDTKYSYKTRFQNTPNQIIESIRSFLPVKLVEITGGEPLLQDEIYELITLL